MGEYDPASREDLENAAVGARDLARIAKAQYDAYLEVGFTEAQTITLIAAWVRETLSNGAS